MNVGRRPVLWDISMSGLRMELSLFVALESN